MSLSNSVFYKFQICEAVAKTDNNNDFSKNRHYLLFQYDKKYYFISSGSFYPSKNNSKTFDWVKRKMDYKTNIPILHDGHIIFLAINNIILITDLNSSVLNDVIENKFFKVCKCENSCEIKVLSKEDFNPSSKSYLITDENINDVINEIIRKCIKTINFNEYNLNQIKNKIKSSIFNNSE